MTEDGSASRPGAAASRPGAAVIVLAAGSSQRFGAATKQLADFGGVPLVVRVVRQALESSARPVLVVVDPQVVGVVEALAGLEVSIVPNPDAGSGQSSSIRRGLAALPRATAGAVFVNSDQPFVSGEVIDALIDRWDGSGEEIVVSGHAGRRGSPVLFGRTFFPALRALSGDQGGRSVLAAARDSVVELELATEAALLDADTPEELDRLRRLHGNLEP